jgi:energy-coupling factor transport system ATP-binding protein
VESLSHSYRISEHEVVRALRQVNLNLARGEFVAVIGQNGSGKSTLAKHLNGLLIPGGGDVRVNGLSTAMRENIRAIRAHVGMVFQNPDNQLVSTVVEEDVAFGPENLGVAPEEIRSRVEWALDTLHMLDYRYESPGQLSDGQKQLVAIAGVLAMKPACIVLDEPTALLDPLARHEVLRSLKRLNREEGITILLITHFMQEAIEFDRIVVMADGEIKMDGPPREIFKQVELIRDLGLDLPVPLQLARKLNARGIPVPPDTLSAEELVDYLCQLK